MNKQSIAVLNLSDGVITTYGYLLAIIVKSGSLSNKHQFISGAIGAGISMAIGQRLEDFSTNGETTRQDFLVALGASIIGSIIPPLGYLLFSGLIAALIAAVLTVLSAITVMYVLRAKIGLKRAVLNVSGLFAIGIALELLLSL